MDYGVLFPSEIRKYMMQQQEVQPMYYICFYDSKHNHIIVRDAVPVALENIIKEARIINKDNMKYFVMAGIFNNEWEEGIPPEQYLPGVLDEVMKELKLDYVGLHITQSDNAIPFFWRSNHKHLYRIEFYTGIINNRPELPELKEPQTN